MQYSLDRQYASLPEDVQTVEDNLIKIVDYDASGNIIYREFEVAVAIIQITNRADDFIKAKGITPILLSELNFIISNSINSLRIAVSEIVDACSAAYLNNLNTKLWVFSFYHLFSFWRQSLSLEQHLL